MRSHTGVVLTLGGGALYSSSTKQKLNTRSSTKPKLVGVNDAFPQVLWTRQFLNGQGYGHWLSDLSRQQSAMLLEKHGKTQVVNENAKKMCNIILWRIELCCVLSGQEWTSKYDFRMRKVDFVSMHVKARNVWTRLRWCCSCAAEFVLGWQPSTQERLEMCS